MKDKATNNDRADTSEEGKPRAEPEPYYSGYFGTEEEGEERQPGGWGHGTGNEDPGEVPDNVKGTSGE